MIEESIDIGQELRSLCQKLGLVEQYSNVASLVIEPSTVRATVYLNDENGSKYIEEDTNEPASEEVSFKVST